MNRLITLALILLAGCASTDQNGVSTVYIPEDSPRVERGLRVSLFEAGQLDDKGTLGLTLQPGIDASLFSIKLVGVTREHWEQSDHAGTGVDLSLATTWQANQAHMVAYNVSGYQRLYLVAACVHNTKYEHLGVIYDELVKFGEHYVKPLPAVPDCHCFEANWGWLYVQNRS